MCVSLCSCGIVCQVCQNACNGTTQAHPDHALKARVLSQTSIASLACELCFSECVCRYHKLTLTLLKASWRRSQRLVCERRSAIVKVAEAMMKAEDERITGEGG